MNINEELIKRFYIAFQQKDFKTMQECYADNATFTDEVFIGLNAKQVRCMWEMLIKGGKDLRVEFSNINVNGKTGSALWIANYTFSKTGRKVVNRIEANFEFENGKIISHRDRFNFYKWALQALGFTGFLLGWTPFLKQKIRNLAIENLNLFMTAK